MSGTLKRRRGLLMQPESVIRGLAIQHNEQQDDLDEINTLITELRGWKGGFDLILGCADCGEKHPACLEFHHLDASTKDDGVMKLVDLNARWPRIEAEIAKCEVLCSNCHRKRHYNEKRATDAVA